MKAKKTRKAKFQPKTDKERKHAADFIAWQKWEATCHPEDSMPFWEFIDEC